MHDAIALKTLKAEPIAPERFKPYGQVIFPALDGKPYDSEDAQLDLSNGIPRFYLMRLTKRGREFHTITRHVRCTQCLGSLGGQEWLMAVAPPSESDRPDLNELVAFRIPGNCFIKLELGTWHAGPYFDSEFIDFYNLELSDTNVVDHFTHDFAKRDNLQFEIVGI